MARDAGLEAVLEADLQGTHGLTRKTMFGGLAWLVQGNLLCGARVGRMMLRVGKKQESSCLAIPGVQRVVMGRRQIAGWIWLCPAVYEEDDLRQQLLAMALDQVRTLPPK